MKKRRLMGLAVGTLLVALLPGITLGADASGPGGAGAAVSAEAGASSVEPAKRHFRGKNKPKNNKPKNKQDQKPKTSPIEA